MIDEIGWDSLFHEDDVVCASFNWCNNFMEVMLLAFQKNP